MSRDDTIVMLRIKSKGRFIWIVIHAQSVENFEDKGWLMWYLSSHMSECRYTKQYTSAVKVSKAIFNKLNKEGYSPPEYGIRELQTNFDLDEYDNDIKVKNGRLIFNKKYAYLNFETYKECPPQVWWQVGHTYKL